MGLLLQVSHVPQGDGLVRRTCGEEPVPCRVEGDAVDRVGMCFVLVRCAVVGALSGVQDRERQIVGNRADEEIADWVELDVVDDGGVMRPRPLRTDLFLPFLERVLRIPVCTVRLGATSEGLGIP